MDYRRGLEVSFNVGLINQSRTLGGGGRDMTPPDRGKHRRRDPKHDLSPSPIGDLGGAACTYDRGEGLVLGVLYGKA